MEQINDNHMQMFPPAAKHYVCLVPCVVLACADFPAAHVACAGVYCLLLKAGVVFQNYCNMAGALVLSLYLLLDNLAIFTDLLANSVVAQPADTFWSTVSCPIAIICCFEAVALLEMGGLVWHWYKAFREEVNSIYQ